MTALRWVRSRGRARPRMAEEGMVTLTGGRRLALSTIALVIVASIIVGLQVRGTRGLTGWGNTVGSSNTAPDTRSPVERQLDAVQAQLRQNPNDVKALGQLGQIYLQRARETGDPAYYPRA